jgi:hypothetical protein
VYKVRHRMLRERLEQMVATAERASDDECVRLALLCLSLLERHQVTDKGRCRYCRPQRDWWWRRGCLCTVVSALSFYLEQPREFLSR